MIVQCKITGKVTDKIILMASSKEISGSSLFKLRLYKKVVVVQNYEFPTNYGQLKSLLC